MNTFPPGQPSRVTRPARVLQNYGGAPWDEVYWKVEDPVCRAVDATGEEVSNALVEV